MSTSHGDRHEPRRASPDPEHVREGELQAYLEGELPADRTAAVESHLAGCARCAAETDAYATLFRELEDLPRLEPSEGLRHRVLEEVGPGPSFITRLLRRLGSADRARAATRHLTGTGAQDLLDGVLAGGPRRRVTGHVAGCDRCRSELEAWRSVFARLGSLEPLAPSAGFADRVMARVQSSEVRVQDGAPGWLDRIAGATASVAAGAQRLVPTSGWGWAAVCAVAAVPTAGLLLALGLVMAHPLLTVPGLLALVQWRLGAVLNAVASDLANAVIGSAVWLRLQEVATELVASPELVAAFLLLVWAGSVWAGWVVYRNVISPSSMANRNA